MSETAGGAGKTGGGIPPYPNGRGGAVAALSAPLRACRAAGGRTGCHDRVPVQGSDAWCDGVPGRAVIGSGGAGGSTGKRHPVDPTHPLPPDRSMPHQKYLTWYSTHTITPFTQLILKPTPPPILNSKIDEGGHRKRHPPFLRGA